MERGGNGKQSHVWRGTDWYDAAETAPHILKYKLTASTDGQYEFVLDVTMGDEEGHDINSDT